MRQIVSITQARNNLSDLVSQVSQTLNPVVIVRDSQPEAALVPYSQIQQADAQWKQKWEELLVAGKKAGKAWSVANKVNTDQLSEEEVYDLVKQA